LVDLHQYRGAHQELSPGFRAPQAPGFQRPTSRVATLFAYPELMEARLQLLDLGFVFDHLENLKP
jgi:hypothetical protein